MFRRARCANGLVFVLLAAHGVMDEGRAQPRSAPASWATGSPEHSVVREFVEESCVECHPG